MVSHYISDKLKVLSFFAIYLVVTIHSYFPGVERYGTFDLFQRFFTFYFCNLFLPFFFCVSGFLFYINITKSCFSVWKRKFKSRIESLVIPYIIWNLFFLIVMIFLQLMPVTKGWLNSDILHIYFSGSFLDTLWLVFSKPVNFPLWFIAHLILITPFTPFIWIIVKSKFWIIPIFFGFYLSWSYNISISFVFYYLGALLSIRKVDVEVKITSKSIMLLLVVSIFVGIIISSGFLVPKRNILFFLSIFPMLLLWFGYDKIIELGGGFNFLDAFIPYTFFIYVFHEPYLNIFKKIIIKIGGFSEVSYWVAYIFSPLLTVFLAFLIGVLWRRTSIKTYSLVVGNRV